jgi:CheY-like chemotaxis protein
MEKPVHILVVDDQPILCDALAKYLEDVAEENEKPITISSAHSVEEAIAALGSTREV